MERFGNGRNGWALLIVGVAVWDILFDDTLSEAFARAVHSRRSAPALVTVWAVLTAHLFDFLPERFDPFHVVLMGAKHLPKVRARVVVVLG